jgi:hypothetical protein
LIKWLNKVKRLFRFLFKNYCNWIWARHECMSGWPFWNNRNPNWPSHCIYCMVSNTPDTPHTNFTLHLKSPIKQVLVIRLYLLFFSGALGATSLVSLSNRFIHPGIPIILDKSTYCESCFIYVEHVLYD